MSAISVQSTGPQRISSAFNSVTEGINGIKNAEDIKQAVNIFSKAQDSFVNSSVLSSNGMNISAEAQIQAPNEYYGMLPVFEKELVNATELKKNLKDPNLDVAKGMDSLLKSIRDLSGEDRIKLQMILEKKEKATDTFINLIKLLQKTSTNIVRNIKA